MKITKKMKTIKVKIIKKKLTAQNKKSRKYKPKDLISHLIRYSTELTVRLMNMEK